MTFNRRSGYVQLGKGFKLPKRLTAHYSGSELPFRVSLDLQFENGRLECRELKCTRERADVALTTETLRQVPVGRLIQDAAEIVVSDEDLRMQIHLLSEELDYESIAKAGPVPETLEWVAVVYRFAYAVHEDPTKKVAERFAVSQSTATRWVRKARELGLLGSAVKGFAGEF